MSAFGNGLFRFHRRLSESSNSVPLAPDVVFALTGDVRRNSRALRQLRSFQALGLRVTVLAASTPGDLLGSEVVPLGVPLGSGPRFFLRNHRAVASAVRGLPSARVYHASDLYVLPALAAAARRAGARLVYDARELYPHVFGTVGKPWATAFWSAIERRYGRQADAVFTVNESIARLLEPQVRQRPVVVYNAPEERAASPEPPPSLRAQTGLSADVPLVLYQGGLTPHRGLSGLVEAMADVPGAALVFMGSGPLAEPLRARMAEVGLGGRGFVVPPTPPDTLLAVTATADVGVSLLDDVCRSHHYALPNKLFEYLAAGLPVVACDLPEFRRVLDGGAGLLVPPGDTAALAAALRSLTADAALRAHLAAHAAEALEPYRAVHSAERFEATYRKLLA